MSMPVKFQARARAAAVLSVILASSLPVPSALADENGISVWLPGGSGSFAAVPGVPGWSLTKVYYHTHVTAGGDIEFPRGGGVDLGLRATGDLFLFGPGYTFEETFWDGGHLTLSMLGVFGRMKSEVDATLTGPLGNQISGTRGDTLTSYGDLFPKATMAWNAGVNNYAVYMMGAIPIGDYDPDRLSNIGLGHGAIDVGGAYTYLNPASGFEFSVTSGLTFNFENPDTNYQNGVDGHIDWAVSQFLNEHVHAGLVGYGYQQLTGDSGKGAVLGDFKSSVFGVGPQVGYKFDVSDSTSGYVNLKGFYEFGNENRPKGWNMWLTLAFTPAAPKPVQ